MPTPPRAAIDAILAGQTKITRRCELYESDATTLFNSNPRMTDGSVSVDYTRNDRRNISVTLNNSDGAIKHNPNGLWYDKIVKVYRGVNYVNTQTQPKVAILPVNTAADCRQMLASCGFTDITILPNTFDGNLSELAPYDILVGVCDTANPFGGGRIPDIATLTMAYDSGKSIFTVSPFETETSLPLIGSLVSLPAQAIPINLEFSNTSTGSPFAEVDEFTMTLGGSVFDTTLPATPRASAFVGANLHWTSGTPSSADGIGVIYEINALQGSKWVHFHGLPGSDQESTDDITYNNWLYNTDIFIKSAIEWLYSYQKNLSWETQVGEFMIDQIVAPRFPKTIQITGRDYWKKLEDSDFDNAISLDAGLLVDDLIRDLATNAGITKFRLGSLGAVTGGTNAFDGATDRGTAILAITNAANVEVFFDAQGYLVTRPFFDPSTSAPTMILNTGNGGSLVDWTETSDDTELYNRVVVSGTSQDSSVTGNIFQGVAENHQAGSPTSFENLGYFRTYYYSSPFFTDNDQCLAYAQSLLAFHSLESFSLDYSSLVFAWLEAGEIIEIDRPDSGIGDPTRFLNVSFTIPLTLDAMTGSAKRITIVG